ncbi:hypothetical protein AGLY_013290, partial [Aphis glycines]
MKSGLRVQQTIYVPSMKLLIMILLEFRICFRLSVSPLSYLHTSFELTNLLRSGETHIRAFCTVGQSIGPLASNTSLTDQSEFGTCGRKSLVTYIRLCRKRTIAIIIMHNMLSYNFINLHEMFFPTAVKITNDWKIVRNLQSYKKMENYFIQNIPKPAKSNSFHDDSCFVHTQDLRRPLC